MCGSQGDETWRRKSRKLVQLVSESFFIECTDLFLQDCTYVGFVRGFATVVMTSSLARTLTAPLFFTTHIMGDLSC
jgi:hypothetical protein